MVVRSKTMAYERLPSSDKWRLPSWRSLGDAPNLGRQPQHARRAAALPTHTLAERGTATEAGARCYGSAAGAVCRGELCSAS